MAYYSITRGETRADGLTVLFIKFMDPADNDRVVPAAIAALAELGLEGGRGVLFNGRSSLPVSMALAHAVAHLYGFVACFDPKMGKYVVCISHTAGLRPGDVLV